MAIIEELTFVIEFSNKMPPRPHNKTLTFQSCLPDEQVLLPTTNVVV